MKIMYPTIYVTKLNPELCISNKSECKSDVIKIKFMYIWYKFSYHIKPDRISRVNSFWILYDFHNWENVF